jgi:hypothetical protein
MSSNRNSLESAATRLLNNYEKFNKLKELGNRNHYPTKLKKLEERLITEVSFWEKKNPSPKLEDLKKDLSFVQKQKDVPFFDKERIDLLTNKYSIGYEQNRNFK